MHARHIRSLTIVIAIEVVSGCAAAPSFHPSLLPSAAETVHAATIVDAGSRKEPELLYIAARARNSVEVFDAAGHGQQPIRQIQGVRDPMNLWVDRRQDLYVAERGGRVAAFARGEAKPFAVLDDSGNYSDSVCGDNNGNVYVPSGGESRSPSTVSVYTNGATKPSETLVDTNTMSGFVDCVVDSLGNLFLLTQGVSSSGYWLQVDELAEGSSSAIVVVGQAQGLGLLAQMAMDQQDDIVINEFYAGRIVFFPPPYTSPSKTIQVGKRAILGFTFDPDGKHIWGQRLDGGQGVEMNLAGKVTDHTAYCPKQHPCAYSSVALSPAAQQ